MSLSVETLAVARKYTDDSLAGAGAVAGVPCKIQSITAITGGNRVTFLWTDNNGDDHTSAMDVMNGVDGEDGKGIQSVTVNAQDHLIITYTDGTTVDAGQIEIHSSVDSVNGQTGTVVLDAEDVGALPDNTSIPSKTSDLTNDSGFATTSDVSTALADYTPTADLTTLLAAKQDTLTFDNAPTENSNNPVKSGGVYSAEADIFAVMGQNGAKNLIPYDIDAMKAVNVGGTWSGNEYTYNGITFAVNSDGTITVSGIASVLTRLAVTIAQFENGKAYTLTGCPEGGNHVDAYTLYTQTVQNYDDGEGVTFNWSSSITSIAIAIFSGVDLTTPITFKPMLRLASDTDDTYVPYAKTNQELTAENEALTNQANDMVNVLGAKNLIPYPYHRQNGYTTNGATFTYDDEGVITVNKVVGNSTVYFALFSNILYPDAEKFLEPNTSYILSMELENATDTSCFVQAQNGSDIAAIRNKATGKYEISFTTTETIDSLAVALYYGAEKTENNAKVKLMIRPASIQDDTWVPYVPTNKELMSCKLNGYVGAKNLLAYPYKHTTKSENGVTFTDNGDGTITVNTPTSASAETTFYLSQSIQSILDTGMYILSGCPSGGNRTSGYFMEFAELATSSSDWKMFGTDTGEGAIAHVDSTRYAIHAYIRIRSGATVSNLTFKPMIRRVEDTDPTWQPYAKTNKELTEDVESARLLQDAVTQHITVTADGTKTVQTLMNELHTALASIISTLDSSETLHVIGARSDGGTWFRPSNVELKYANNNTLGNVSMDSFTVTTGQNCYIYSVTFSSTLATNTFRQMSVLTSGNTFTDRTNDVPTSGTQWIMTYQIYKTV